MLTPRLQAVNQLAFTQVVCFARGDVPPSIACRRRVQGARGDVARHAARRDRQGVDYQWLQGYPYDGGYGVFRAAVNGHVFAATIA
jgi:hypothetical protein